MNRIILIISLITVSPFISFAQSKEEVLELTINTDTISHEYEHKDFDRESISAVQGALFFYKDYISSQDASSCSFSPSCSEYASIAVREQGLIKGLINFFDRFSRCNGESPEDYKYLPKNHLLYDPVRNIKHDQIH